MGQRVRTDPERDVQRYSAVPVWVLIGIVIGWVLGSRAARDAYAAELRRRKVFRVAAFYAVAAFAVAQAADILLPGLNLPPWSVTLVLALLILGCPIALALAWAFEVTPAGLVRTTSLEPQPATAPEGAGHARNADGVAAASRPRGGERTGPASVPGAIARMRVDGDSRSHRRPDKRPANPISRAKR